MQYSETEKNYKTYPPDIKAGYDHIKEWELVRKCTEDEKIRQFWLKMFGCSIYSEYKKSFYSWYYGKYNGISKD